MKEKRFRSGGKPDVPRPRAIVIQPSSTIHPDLDFALKLVRTDSELSRQETKMRAEINELESEMSFDALVKQRLEDLKVKMTNSLEIISNLYKYIRSLEDKNSYVVASCHFLVLHIQLEIKKSLELYFSIVQTSIKKPVRQYEILRYKQLMELYFTPILFLQGKVMSINNLLDENNINDDQMADLIFGNQKFSNQEHLISKVIDEYKYLIDKWAVSIADLNEYMAAIVDPTILEEHMQQTVKIVNYQFNIKKLIQTLSPLFKILSDHRTSIRIGILTDTQQMSHIRTRIVENSGEVSDPVTFLNSLGITTPRELQLYYCQLTRSLKLVPFKEDDLDNLFSLEDFIYRTTQSNKFPPLLTSQFISDVKIDSPTNGEYIEEDLVKLDEFISSCTSYFQFIQSNSGTKNKWESEEIEQNENECVFFSSKVTLHFTSKKELIVEFTFKGKNQNSFIVVVDTKAGTFEWPLLEPVTLSNEIKELYIYVQKRISTLLDLIYQNLKARLEYKYRLSGKTLAVSQPTPPRKGNVEARIGTYQKRKVGQVTAVIKPELQPENELHQVTSNLIYSYTDFSVACKRGKITDQNLQLDLLYYTKRLSGNSALFKPTELEEMTVEGVACKKCRLGRIYRALVILDPSSGDGKENYRLFKIKHRKDIYKN